ncbi:MAG: indole-3-glycerol-phosphate synthase TrpC, partial [Verrucomicrobia bacterium]
MNILETIVAEKQAELKKLMPLPSALENLLWTVNALGPRRNFLSALRYPANGRIGLIAEVKKASPSAGVIC